MADLLGLEFLKHEIQNSTAEELSYMLGRYGGPKNKLLREKLYSNEASKRMTKLLTEALAIKAFEEIVLADS